MKNPIHIILNSWKSLIDEKQRIKRIYKSNLNYNIKNDLVNMKLNPSIKKQWINELISDKYIQGERYLRKWDENEKKFKHCCMGVLCEVAKNIPEIKNKKKDIFSKNGEEHTLIPAYICNIIGFPTDVHGIHSYLIHMNDVEKRSFKEIAKFIESYM